MALSINDGSGSDNPDGYDSSGSSDPHGTVAFHFPSHGARVRGSQEAHRAAPKASPESPTDHGFHAAVSAFWAAMQLSAFWAAMQLLSPTDL
jgi:hypothetical protein